MLFRRQVYSNSSTGLEKSVLLHVQGVWNTPPSPTVGSLLNPEKGLVGKQVFTFEKSFLEDWHTRSLGGQHVISSPVSLVEDLLTGMFSHLISCECEWQTCVCLSVYTPDNLFPTVCHINMDGNNKRDHYRYTHDLSVNNTPQMKSRWPPSRPQIWFYI